MSRKLNMLSAFIVAVNLLITPASYAATEEIVLGAEDGWVPYSNPDGTGMANEIIEAAYDAVSIKVTYVVKPYNRLLKEAEAGRILGAFNVPKDVLRIGQFIFHEEPLYDAVSAYYQNIEAPIGVSKKEDMTDGKTIVGAVVDYGYGDYFPAIVKEGKVIADFTQSDEQNLNKLVAKRIDAALFYDKTANLLFKQMSFDGKVELAFRNEGVGIYVGFSKARKDSQHYADKLDEGLRMIKANGTYQKIVDSY